MQRRQFLTLVGGLAGAALLARSRLGGTPTASAQAIDRATWWPPQPFDLLRRVALEWRYLAGRYTRAEQDFGFVCSLVDYKAIPGFQTARQELIVMRKDFRNGGHTTRTYSGTLAYNATTRTYTFSTPDDPAVAATWTFNATSQTYTVDVASPELTLSALTLRPAGDLIPEGGDGDITSGNLGTTTVLSDYFADWLTLEQDGAAVGLARLDMQTIRPQGLPEGVGDFSHHWFALAGTLADCTPVWISAWQIVSGGNTVWDVTIARHSGAEWSVTSYTEETPAITAPLAIAILAWQPQPVDNAGPDDPARRTGKRWRLTAGASAPADLIDLTLAVPPGQFIKAARIASIRETPMQEAAGAVASGTVGGSALAGVTFLLAESTYSELDPDPIAEPTPDSPIVSPPEPVICTTDPPPGAPLYLPLIRR